MKVVLSDWARRYACCVKLLTASYIIQGVFEPLVDYRSLLWAQFWSYRLAVFLQCVATGRAIFLICHTWSSVKYILLQNGKHKTGQNEFLNANSVGYYFFSLPHVSCWGGDTTTWILRHWDDAYHIKECHNAIHHGKKTKPCLVKQSLYDTQLRARRVGGPMKLRFS